ncbi:MAG: 2Fe-2S iron-sulfur cluster-binding protein [Methylacidiphilales bacterium]|nr:2Fe-2S iron-sulfur cluster-binding protein [Candidatus Methylacidiphilales bacterium]
MKQKDSTYLPLTVTAIDKSTPDSVLITLQPRENAQSGFNFRAGQFLTFIFPNLKNSPVRSYSLCSLPESKILTVGVRVQPQGIASSWLGSSVSVGDTLQSLTPRGNFQLNKPTPHGHALFIAGGSGITPIYPMLSEYLRNSKYASATLLYSNTTSERIMLQEEIAFLKNTYLGRLQIINFFSREPQAVEISNGRLTGEVLTKLIKNNYIPSIKNIDHAYLCGPSQMIESLIKILRSLAMPLKSISSELFTNTNQYIPPYFSKQAAAGATIEIQHLGRTRSISNTSAQKSVLQQGLEQGLELPYSCKAGVCSTCKAKVISGEFVRGLDHVLSEDEKKRGYVLTCQTFTNDKLLSVSFDDV